MALVDFVRQQEWEKLKTYYLNIHIIKSGEYKESENRIESREKGRLRKWTNSKDNIIFRYAKYDFIEAEIRYHKIGGVIYEAFMNDPYSYVNTCATRMSKALNDYGIPIVKLQGMEANACLANAGTNTKPYKILVRVKDMVDFLKANDKFGRLEIYSSTNNTNFYHTFYDEPYSKLVLNDEPINKSRVDKIRTDNKNFYLNLQGKKGVLAMRIEAFGNAWGHITLWDNNSFVDGSDYLPYEKEIIFVKTLYFWEFMR